MRRKRRVAIGGKQSTTQARESRPRRSPGNRAPLQYFWCAHCLRHCRPRGRACGWCTPDREAVSMAPEQVQRALDPESSPVVRWTPEERRARNRRRARERRR